MITNEAIKLNTYTQSSVQDKDNTKEKKQQQTNRRNDLLSLISNKFGLCHAIFMK